MFGKKYIPKRNVNIKYPFKIDFNEKYGMQIIGVKIINQIIVQPIGNKINFWILFFNLLINQIINF